MGNNKNKIRDIVTIKKNVKTFSDSNLYTNLINDIVSFLRSSTPSIANWKIDNLLLELEKDIEFKNGLTKIFCHILNINDPQTIFTQVGISKGGTFISEVIKLLKHNILPVLPHKHTLEYVIDNAFYNKRDFIWVESIPSEKWEQLFTLIFSNTEHIYTLSKLKQNLIDSLTILAYRVPTFGLEDAILSKKLHLEEGIKTPFISLNKQIMSLVHLLSNDNINDDLLLAQADKCKNKIDECNAFIQNIANNIEKYGTSVEQTFMLRSTQSELHRIEYLIAFLCPNSFSDIIQKSVTLFKETVKNLNKKHSIRYLYQSNASMVAYQIAEHKSASGEKYITTTRQEYLNFFNAAVAGGGIIAITATIKALLGNLHLAPFWQYFLYSINYAIAFVLLFITGASLATKQPAMTASALASSLDNRKGTVDYKNFGITFSKVWRSQFASFAGNLITVFPLCYLISFAFTQLTGALLLHDESYAYDNLMAQHPLKSLAWVYACITGVFLFLSGTITGYVDNKVIFSNIGNRIYEHKKLKKILKPQQIDKLAKYVQKNLGGYIGNICLGFFLGYAKLIGDFFGLPFDIRHITISTAYYAFGAENLNNNLVLADWIGVTIGVIGIGFFNFLISFGLAFYVAISSRGVSVTETPKLLKHILKVFVKYPLDFIFPPKKPRTKEEIFN